MHDSQRATNIRTCSAVLFSRVMDVTSMSKKPFLRIRSSSSSVFRTARLAHRKPQYDTTTYVNGSSWLSPSAVNQAVRAQTDVTAAPEPHRP